MLGKLISFRPRPAPARAHDHLFADIAPGGAEASARLLSVIYEEAGEADEPTPQHLHFRALLKAIVGEDDPRRLRALSGDLLGRARAAYVCCFEQSPLYLAQLAAYEAAPAFVALLERTRASVVAELIARGKAEAARRHHLRRMPECARAKLAIKGASVLELVKQMEPDDWHEIVLNWNWDHGVTELEWIIARPDCDRATALAAYCAGKPGDIAVRRDKPTHEIGRWDYGGFVHAVGARLENGFYMNAALSLRLTKSQGRTWAAEIAAARATGESPWRLPDGLLEHPGRPHAPRYTINAGVVRYHYDHWLAHIADR